MRLVLIAATLLSAAVAVAEPPAPGVYPTPEAAMRALVAAAKTKDPAKVEAVLGPDSQGVVDSGDAVADAAALQRFVTAAGQRTTLTPIDGSHTVARLGTDDWPFPVPLVREGTGWRFDTAAGRDELLNRRIGRNELTAIAVCREYVEAQAEYAARQAKATGTVTYAQKVRSTPGARDGLYWDDPDGADPSPLGELMAEATAEGYGQQPPAEGAQMAPYHGYLFRILTAQGPKAPGGAKSWLVDGKLTGGVGLIAWPATYGSSGVMTFVISRQGIVFQKDLGPDTAKAAAAITAYDPDASWTPAR